MKNLIIFLMIVNLQVTANHSLFSQEQVNLDLENVSLKKCIKEIDKQTKYGFLYNGKELNKIDVEKAKFTNTDVKEVLDQLLKENGYTYEIFNDVLLVKKLKYFGRETNSVMQLDTMNVTGVVYDEEGNPLPGVSIYFEETPEIGTATDIDGRYRITKVLEKQETLVFTFLGFDAQVIEIAGRNAINVNMKEASLGLAEVVVTGYQVISTERATGSFQKIDVAETIKTRTSDNIVDIIEGEIPGLEVQTSGDGNRVMVLRGRNNFTEEDVEPLIVVDGFEINASSIDAADPSWNTAISYLEKLNPNDIENLVVLKDAAAASIWGAKAANGVIVITTKTGRKADNPNISYNSSYSIKEKPNYYNSNIITDIDTYLELDQYAVGNNWVSAPSTSYASRANNVGRQTYYDLANGNITQAEADAIINGLRQNDLIKEGTKLFLRNYTMQRHSLSMNQATDKLSYYASVNYTKTEGESIGNDEETIQASLNLSTKLNDKIKFSTRFAMSSNESKQNGTSFLHSAPLYQRILDDEGNYIPQPQGYHDLVKYDPAYNPFIADGNEYPYDWDYNLKREHDNSDETVEALNIDLSAKLDFDIYKGIKGLVQYNYQNGTRSSRDYRNEETYFVRDWVNSSEIYEGGVFSHFGIPLGGYLDRNNNEVNSHGLRGQLNYSGFLTADKKHYLNAIGGIEYRQVEALYNSPANVWGYDPQTLTYAVVDYVGEYYDRYQSWASKILYSDGVYFSEDLDRYLSYYGNMGYTYNDKYSVTASARLDDSNLFGSSPEYRNIPLWSAGVKWQLAKEGFMQFDFMNRLDFRFSYGTGGNINKSLSKYLLIIEGRDWYTQVPTAYIRNPKNDDLRWEKTTTLNMALDYAFFNNRLFGSLEYYNKYSEWVIARQELNPTYGLDGMSRNYGELSNTGYTLVANYQILNKEVNWLVGLDISRNKNIVEQSDAEKSVGVYMSPYYFNEGEEISGMYAYKWAGLDENGAPQVYDENGGIVDYTTNIESVDALAYVGQLTPKYFGSFKTNVSYKGFSLNALITYKLGHVFKRNSVYFGGVRYNQLLHEDWGDRWQNPGDELTTNVPAMLPSISGNYDNYYNNSDIVYHDAGHIRLSSLSLNYTFSAEMLKNRWVNVKSITLGADARNLGLLWTANEEGIDPELGNYAGTAASRPIYSFNLSINL